MKSCKVCGISVRIRNGYYQSTCEACQKFFRRYCPTRDRLKCNNSGADRQQCVIDVTMRPYCLKCRFDKCLAAGMFSRKLLNKTTNESEAEQELILNPVLYDGTSVENSLRIAVQAFTLLHGYHFLEFCEPFQIPENVDHTFMVALGTRHVVNAANIASKYCHFLTDAEGVTNEESQLLMKGFTSRSVMAFHALTGNRQANFLGINNAFKEFILRDLEEFREAWNLSEQVHNALLTLDCSFVETAVLFALLLFNEQSELASPKVRCIRHRLLLALGIIHQQERLTSPPRDNILVCERVEFPSTSSTAVPVVGVPPGRKIAFSNDENDRRYFLNCLKMTQSVFDSIMRQYPTVAAKGPELEFWSKFA